MERSRRVSCASTVVRRRMIVSFLEVQALRSTDFTTVRGANKLRFQMADEVRVYEKAANDDNRCWLWQRRIVSCPGASATERSIDFEQATRSQFNWRSRDS